MFKPIKTIKVKHGNTFSLFCSYTDDSGVIIPLNDTTIIAEIKNQARELVGRFDTIILNESDFKLTLPSVELTDGVYFTDIRFIQNGVIRNTDIIQINIVEVVTDAKA